MRDERGRGIGLGADHGAPRAEDAGLLARDVLAGRAEVIHVIEIDARHDGDVGGDDVDRVEAAAQPHLEDRDVETGARERLQCRQRAVFEIGQRNVAARVLHGVERGDERGIAQRQAGDAHALVVAGQMRRRVEAVR